MEYSFRNKLDPAQHTAIKYITRFREKGGIQDLYKAIHTIELLIELEYGNALEAAAAVDEMNGLKTYGNGVDD